MEKDSNEPPKKPVRRFLKARVGYGPVAAVIVLVLSYLVSQIFAATIVSFGAGFFGYEPREAIEKLSSSTNMQFAYIVLVEAITLYVLWVFLKARKVPWKDIGLSRRPVLKDVGLALITFCIYFAVLIVVSLVMQHFIPGLDTDQKQQIGFKEAVQPGQLILVFVSLVILPPVVEEIMIRGFLYTGLRARFTKITSAIVASVIFGIAHLQLGSDAPPLWIAAVDTLILSLFLIHLREKTGALWSGMIVHAVKNGLAFTALFVVK